MEVDTEPVSGWLNFCWGLLFMLPADKKDGLATSR